MSTKTADVSEPSGRSGERPADSLASMGKRHDPVGTANTDLSVTARKIGFSAMEIYRLEQIYKKPLKQNR